jgi:hypothetical protein
VKRLPALAALLALAAGCALQSEGDFEGVPFSPHRLVFGVADRHDLLPSGGSLTAVRRGEEQQRLTLLFSAAAAPTDEDWRLWSAARLLTFKKDLAVSDGLLLSDIPVSRVQEGASLELFLDESGRQGRGAFGADLVVALPASERVAKTGLGADVSVKLLFDSVRIEPRSGSVSGRVELKRARGPRQEGEVATGEVTLHFTAPLLPERLGKANLTVASPVLRCAAAMGPSLAGLCKDEPADPFLDASWPLAGR